MFGFKKKPKPSIKTDFYKVEFDSKLNQWSLQYKGVEFIYSKADIDLPKPDLLDTYLGWVTSHKAHIEESVKQMCEGWEDVFVNPSAYHVSLIEVESEDRIAVMILGDDTWGDMGYDLWIEDGVIKNEGFGD